MDTTNFTLLFSLIIIVSLDHTICKDDVLVKSCPEDKASWDTAARRKECKPADSKNYVYHCLKNERQELVETCLVAQWIEIGVCPVLFNGGNFGFENCTLIMLRTGGACPKEAYRSNELYRFPICFEILPKSTMTQLNATTETTTVSVTSTPGDGKSVSFNGGILGVTAGVIVPLLVFGIIIIVIYLKNKRRQDYNKAADVEHGQEGLDEKDPFLPNKQMTGPPERRIVQLTAFAKGLHILKEHGILIITGQIGSGKTTAMEIIIQLLQEEDSEWKVEDISFLGKSHSPYDKLVIKRDDCFGKFVTNPVKKNTKDRLEEIFKLIKEGEKNRKSVLTMTESEFTYFGVKEKLGEVGFAEDCHMCLDNMSEEEKESLIAEISQEVCSCDEFSDICKTKLTNELMGKTESATLSLLGWPLICRLASIPCIAKNINSFKTDPVRCVMSLFDTLQSTNQQLYCAMIYVLFKGSNTIDSAVLREVIETFKPAQDGEKLIGSGKSESTDDQVEIFRSKLNKIVLTHPDYFVNKDKECFEFHHDIFVLWLLCHFYQKHPEVTIRHFEFDVLTELLRPINYIPERSENDIALLCSVDDKKNVPKENAVVEKHNNPAELVEGDDGDKKHVQCEEDIEQRVHSETGIQTISSDTLNSEEGRSESQSWKFTLEEKMFPCFIKRVVNEKEKVQKLQVEKEQKYDILEDHPFLEDKTFMRIYKVEALTSVQGSKLGEAIKDIDIPPQTKFGGGI